MIIKWILILFIFMHGSMHIVGWAVNLNRAVIGTLTGKLSFGISEKWRKPIRSLWILATLLFFISAFGLMFHQHWWYWETLSAVIVSQILIAICWHDAKTGTFANILILASLLLI